MNRCKYCNGEIVAKCNADIILGLDKNGCPNEDDIREIDKSWLCFYVCDKCGRTEKYLENISK